MTLPVLLRRAHFATGVRPSRFDLRVADPVRLPLVGVRPDRDGLRGHVVLVDRFGNLVTSITMGA